jgi:hypothetical protein
VLIHIYLIYVRRASILYYFFMVRSGVMVACSLLKAQVAGFNSEMEQLKASGSGQLPCLGLVVGFDETQQKVTTAQEGETSDRRSFACDIHCVSCCSFASHVSWHGV